jgi:hypothetical protein
MRMFPCSPAHPLYACLLLTFMFSAIGIAQNAPSTNTLPADGKTASVVVVVDTSKSARNNLGTLRNGATALTSQFSSNDEVALFFAGDKPVLVQEFTGDTSLITNKLKKIRTNGKMALFETLTTALDHARSDAANEQRAVIAFVNDLDGASAAAETTLENAIRNKPGVPVFLIALRQTSWKAQESAQRVAVLSGGAAFFPQKSSEVPAIARTIAVRLGGRAANDVDLASAESLKNYKTVVVRGIPVADNGSTAQFAEGDSLLLHKLLISRLERANLFASVKDGSTLASDVNSSPSAQNSMDAAAARSDELELLPMVVAYHQPGQKQRQFLSPFAGGSRLSVQVVLRDRLTREPVAAFVEEASASQGWFSGSNERNQAEAMMTVTNKIVSRLRDLRKASASKKK